jgi:hypothetical protein
MWFVPLHACSFIASRHIILFINAYYSSALELEDDSELYFIKDSDIVLSTASFLDVYLREALRELVCEGFDIGFYSDLPASSLSSLHAPVIVRLPNSAEQMAFALKFDHHELFDIRSAETAILLD